MFCLMHNNDAINVMYEYCKKRIFFFVTSIRVYSLKMN